MTDPPEKLILFFISYRLRVQHKDLQAPFIGMIWKDQNQGREVKVKSINEPHNVCQLNRYVSVHRGENKMWRWFVVLESHRALLSGLLFDSVSLSAKSNFSFGISGKLALHELRARCMSLETLAGCIWDDSSYALYKIKWILSVMRQ